MIFLLYFLLAGVLFLSINWIGRHAVDFGYSSSNLFETPTESVALNILVRVVAPTVFIVIFSAACVSFGEPQLRLGIYWTVIIYYVIRAMVIVAIDRVVLVNWWRYFAQAALGSILSYWAYVSLILPNKSLLPNLETIGNEVWLAIFAFLYAISNKVELSENAVERRKQNYITQSYRKIRNSFSDVIEESENEDELKLLVYGVAIYENYCRPPFIRMFERAIFWRETATTGLMQVSDRKSLSDFESVCAGVSILKHAWDTYKNEPDGRKRLRKVLSQYNNDADYIDNVDEVMYLLSERTDQRFQEIYEKLIASG